MSTSVKYKVQFGSIWNRFKLVGLSVDYAATDEASTNLIATNPVSGWGNLIYWATYRTL